MRKNIQSEFSIKQVIVIPTILISVMFFLCSIITFASIKTVEDGTPLYMTPIWTVIPFALLLIWTIRYYLKTFKRYTFLDKGFEVSNIFGKEFYSWKTVRYISIITNSYEKVLWQYIREDTLSIYLKNGRVIELYSKYYKNMSKIRSYFNFKNKLNIINSYTKKSNKSIRSFGKKTYKGSFAFSFNGVLTIFFLLLSSFMLWYSWSSMTLIGFVFLTGIPVFILSIFGFQSYYFQLEKKHLIIRNHIFLNFKHLVNLEKVRVVYFEQKFKKEPSIRIINKDYSMILFQGSTLKHKQWMSLIINLKNKGINIVDELFYEYNE